MAKRTTRQLIRDRMEGAVKDCDRARHKLEQVEREYLIAGEPRGMDLRSLQDLLSQVRDMIHRWRRERT